MKCSYHSVRELRVCDRDLPDKALKARTVVNIRCLFESFGDQRIDGRIDPADEEARDARNVFDIVATRDPRFETLEVRLRDGLVSSQREQQGDVNVDAVFCKLLDRRYTLDSARDLDHDVLASDCCPQSPCFRDRALRVMRKKR